MPSHQTSSVPKALRAYKVKAIDSEGPRPKRMRLRGEREPYARDIRRALRLQVAAALAIAGTAEPIAITVASVTKAAGRGRSQLYNKFGYLLDEIHDANQRVEAAVRASKRIRPRTKESLAAELRCLRGEMKREVARLASTQLSDLLRRLGPELRKNEIAVARVATLKRKLRESESARATLSDINKGWMAEVNRRSTPGEDGQGR